ncbi:SDR family oxidoreductase [Streptomyces xanthochromogenes]|uniref:SDR family oxidoreductase n=1 Tax=Streptomyces xanthochromogenes TaxID=67384 RepID=UPI00342B4E66
MNRSRPTVLLTGSTGVIGSALLPSLAARYEVLALVHRRRPVGVACVEGDLTVDGLGLSESEWSELAGRIDSIVHCGALTDFAAPDLRAFADINVEGTRRILQLAQDADVPVVLLSSASAVMDVTEDDLAARNLRAYGRSKRRAEELAIDSGLHIAMVRTALIFAERAAVAPPVRQFPHTLFDILLRGRTGGLPVQPDHWCDIVPMETLVAYLTALTEVQLRGDAALTSGVHWVTAGPARLTAADVADACAKVLTDAGRPPKEPLLSPPAVVRTRSHGLARLAQLGFQPPERAPLPCDLVRLLPAQLDRDAVLEALEHNIRLCADAFPRG